MSEADDLDALTDSLARQLREAGLPEAGERLSRLVHGVAWTTSSERIGELGQALLAIRRIHGADLPTDVVRNLEAAIASVRSVWPDPSETEPEAQCPACGELRERVEIRLPGQLERVLAFVRATVREGELRVLPHPKESPTEAPFSSLSEEGPWPDVLDYRFQCNRCGTHFSLRAETYHGSGGEWKPLP